MAVDLSDHHDATDLVLEFWAREGNENARNTLYVEVSGDAQTWARSSRLSSLTSEYDQMGVDLDEALQDANIALDEDVYIRFRHIINEFGGPPPRVNTFYIDELRVSRRESFYPNLESHSLVYDAQGDVSGIVIRFTKPVQDVSTSTVTIRRIGFTSARWSGEPMRLDDGRSYLFNFSAPLRGPGQFEITIHREITDLEGRFFNQVAGEYRGEDERFRISVDERPVAAPYEQPFEDRNQLAGWTLPYRSSIDGGQLVITGNVARFNSPMLAIETSQVTRGEQLGLAFRAAYSVTDADRHGVISLSADQEHWHTLVAFFEPADLQQYTFDFDHLLREYGLVNSDVVYLRFDANDDDTHIPNHLIVDDVRLQLHDGHRLVVTSIAMSQDGENQVDGFDVTFNKWIPQLTADAVTLNGPRDTDLAISHVERDSANTQRFHVRLAVPEEPRGIFEIRFDSSVTDEAGWELTLRSDVPETIPYVQSLVVGGVPIDIPYEENFEDPNAWRDNWSVVPRFGEVDSYFDPDGIGGDTRELAFTGEGAAALLHADLSSIQPTLPLTLEFSARTIEVAAAGLTVSFSDDLRQWRTLRHIELTTEQRRYFMDLKPWLEGSKVLLDHVVHFRFQTSAATGEAITVDDVRMNTVDLSGPSIESVSFDDAHPRSLVIQFDRPIEDFTTSAITLRHPGGDVVPLPETYEHRDSRIFRIEFAEVEPPGGEYMIVIDGTLHDRDGRFLNEDTLGFPGPSHSATLQLATSPRLIPYENEFSTQSMGALSGWTLATPGSSAISITSTPDDGADYVLRLTGDEATAILSIDVSQHTNVDPLGLRFHAGTHQKSTDRSFLVSVSNDMNSWFTLGNAQLFSVGDEYSFDLTERVGNGHAGQGDTLYIRWQGRTTGGDPIADGYLDNVTVAPMDVVIPRITQMIAGPAGQATEFLDVRFSEPVKGIRADGIHLRGPWGQSVPVARVDSLDERTYRFRFVDPQQVAGSFEVRMASAVFDLAGNPLNGGQSGWIGEFQTMSESIVPAETDLEDVSLGWHFDPGSGTIGRHATDGATRLAFTATSEQTADLVLNLAEISDPSEWFFQYAYAPVDGREREILSVRDPSDRWQELKVANRSNGLRFYALADILELASLDADQNVSFRFQILSPGGELSDVRLGIVDVFGPYVSDLQPILESGETGDALRGIQLQFNEPVQRLDSNQVVVIDGGGNRPPLSVDPVPGGDGRTYRINIEEGQILPGQVTVGVYPTVVDHAGNALNPDQGTQNGELQVLTFSLDEQAGHAPFSHQFGSSKESGTPNFTIVSDSGHIRLVEADGQINSRTLELTRTPVGGIQIVRFKFDLSTAQMDAPLVFGFQAEADNYPFRVEVSGGGVGWWPFREIGYDSARVSHYFSLAPALSEAGITWDNDVYIRIVHRNLTTTASGRLQLDDIRLKNNQVARPWVTSFTPHESHVPVSGFDIHFSEPVLGFTADAISVTDPYGTLLELAGEPIDRGDRQTFGVRLEHSAQVAGFYDVWIEGSITNDKGYRLDQDQVSPAGEPVHWPLRFLPFPLSVPWSEDFEGIGSTPLAGWEVGPGVRIGQGALPSGRYLEMPPASEIVLLVDLSGYASDPRLAFDFTASAIVAESEQITIRLEASGDGATWTEVDAVQLDGSVRHFQWSLAQELALRDIALDDDVFFRIRADAFFHDFRALLDRMRIGVDDAMGPDLVTMRPRATSIRGGIGEVFVGFDEPVSPLTQEDVQVLSPSGLGIRLFGDPRMGSDGRSARLVFESSQTLGGDYIVSVHPTVTDIHGNALNVNKDRENGEAAYVERFHQAARPLSVPHEEDFERKELGSLDGWVADAGKGRIDIVSVNGTSALALSSGSPSVVGFSLGAPGQPRPGEVIITFSAKRASDSTHSALFFQFSDGGDTWNTWGTTQLIGLATEWQTFTFDIGELLAATSQLIEERVHVRFYYRSAAFPENQAFIDNVRLASQIVAPVNAKATLLRKEWGAVSAGAAHDDSRRRAVDSNLRRISEPQLDAHWNAYGQREDSARGRDWRSVASLATSDFERDRGWGESALLASGSNSLTGKKARPACTARCLTGIIDMQDD